MDELERIALSNEPIVLPVGYQRLCAEIFGVGEASACRYLNGLYRNKNKNIDLIHRIRRYALQLQDGVHLWLTRDQDGGLYAFTKPPIKDLIGGQWYSDNEHTDAIEYPEILVPQGVNPQWADVAPIRIKITKV